MSSSSHVLPAGESAIYAELCAANAEGSRYLGMIEPEAMGAAVEDPSSITIAVGGQIVPGVVSIRYASGYDVERSAQIVGGDPENVYYFSLPSNLGGIALRRELATGLQGRRGFIFYDTTLKRATPPLLTEALVEARLDYVEVPLLDPEAESGNEQASISLYGLDIPSERPEETCSPSLKELYQFYLAGVERGDYPYDSRNGTVIMGGAEISEELLEDMWSLYRERFMWLGEKHPVSMEDTKEQFTGLIKSEDTLASIRFEEGRPICFTYFSGPDNKPYWLNEVFLNDKQKMRMTDSEKLLFFPGIVASRKNAGSSLPVLSVLARAVFDANARYRVVFENTNRSERYIPRLVQQTLNRLGRVQVSMPELLDRTVYGCVRFGEPTVAEQ